MTGHEITPASVSKCVYANYLMTSRQGARLRTWIKIYMCPALKKPFGTLTCLLQYETGKPVSGSDKILWILTDSVTNTITQIQIQLATSFQGIWTISAKEWYFVLQVFIIIQDLTASRTRDNLIKFMDPLYVFCFKNGSTIYRQLQKWKILPYKIFNNILSCTHLS